MEHDLYTYHHMSSKPRTTLQTDCMLNYHSTYTAIKKTKKYIQRFPMLFEVHLWYETPTKNQETPNKQGHNADVKPETTFKKRGEQCYMNDPDQSTVSIADWDRK